VTAVSLLMFMVSLPFVLVDCTGGSLPTGGPAAGHPRARIEQRSG
jgi:hypothetical protein